MCRWKNGKGSTGEVIFDFPPVLYYNHPAGLPGGLEVHCIKRVGRGLFLG